MLKFVYVKGDYMDTINSKILECLSHNARMNASEIADNVKLSVSAVIERIKKLEADGTIVGYFAELSPAKLGKDVTALILVTVEHPKFNEGFLKAIKQHPSIIECYYIAGDYDYVLKVVTESTKSLELTLNDIKRIEGVSKTKTNIVLSAFKDDNSVLLQKLN